MSVLANLYFHQNRSTQPPDSGDWRINRLNALDHSHWLKL